MRILFTLIFSIACMSTIAHAQLIPTANADIVLTPKQPAPGQETRLELKTSYIDPNRADIVWFVNGNKAAEGVGLTKVRIRAGELGSEVRITAQATEPDGATVVGERIVRPMIIDLVWEAESYTPVIYRGRALPSSGTAIKAETNAFFVRADGTRIPRSELIYIWKRDNTVLQNISGAGKYAAYIPLGTFAGDHTLSVEVSSRDNAFVGSTEARIALVDPTIELYEDNPVQGILLHDAIVSGDSFFENEVTFMAIPFFSSLQRLSDPTALFSWLVNGVTAPVDETDPARLTVSRGNADLAGARLNVLFTDQNNLLQDDEQSWNIIFSGSERSLNVDSSNPFAPRTQ